MKQNKILGVFAIAMTLVLAACGGGGGGKSSRKPTHKHEYDAGVVTTEPTCTTEGVKTYTCKNTDGLCTKVTKTESIPALGHKKPEPLVKQNEVEPTCTEEGGYDYVCARCGQTVHETVPANGHTLEVDAEGNPVITVLSEATCTKAGISTQKCIHCDYVERTVTPAKGHDFVAEPDDGVAPAADHAKVRIYTCQNGCNKSYFGFNADEVTAESKTHLVVRDDGGTRFWGRPIGNDVPLNESGDPDQDNHPSIFNKNQPGDFFEYKFTLTDEQAGEFMCYADAAPADHMASNNLDFFAGKASDVDWTRGMYIDDNPDHLAVDDNGDPIMVDVLDDQGQPTGEKVQQGKDITDYRYVLYVDGNIVDFDPEITNPVTSQNRSEFVIPYKFNLHAGENSISLRMAGGYRSHFYKFTFRSVEEQEPAHEHIYLEETVPAGAATDALVKRYVCQDPTCLEPVKYVIDVETAKMTCNDETNGWKTKPGTEFKLNNGYTATFTFALPKGFQGKMYQVGYMDSYSSNKNKLVYFQTNSHSNIEVKVNDTLVDNSHLAELTFTQALGANTAEGSSNSETKPVEIGNCALATANTVTYKRVETLNMIISQFVFIGNDVQA